MSGTHGVSVPFGARLEVSVVGAFAASAFTVLACHTRRLMGRLATIFLMLYAQTAVPAQPSEEVRIGQPLPDVALLGLNGTTHHLADYRGRPLIINVWASWCGPCRKEMMSLERLAWRNAAARFSIIGISTDDTLQPALALLDGTHATISHFIDDRLTVERLLGASRLPLTVLIDARGRLLARIYGARQWDGVEALQLIGKTFRIPMDESLR